MYILRNSGEWEDEKRKKLLNRKRKELVITCSLKRHASGIIHHGNYIHQTPHPPSPKQKKKRTNKENYHSYDMTYALLIWAGLAVLASGVASGLATCLLSLRSRPAWPFILKICSNGFLGWTGSPLAMLSSLFRLDWVGVAWPQSKPRTPPAFLEGSSLVPAVRT